MTNLFKKSANISLINYWIQFTCQTSDSSDLYDCKDLKKLVYYDEYINSIADKETNHITSQAHCLGGHYV